MKLKHRHVTKIGKFARTLSRLRGGNGSALPGLVIETLDPDYLVECFQSLPVVIITGTNGKTTTTKIVSSLLRDQGLRVFTNKTGSNFTRGVIASALAESNQDGVIEADIAVLELDEAYATHFVKQVAPKYSLLLNVMRDQLDRFGEIDHTARLLEKVALATTDGVVLNRDDTLVRSIADVLSSDIHVRYFGLTERLRERFPSDDEMYGAHQPHAAKLPYVRSTDVLLDSIRGNVATFSFGQKTLPGTTLRLQGLYNMQNAAGALALVRMILDDQPTPDSLLKTLKDIRPAFGRGEAIDIEGEPLEIVLVKNPAGFRLALESYAKKPAATMIAINDRYADGRDMSWLWDVTFTSLPSVAMVSGIRAYDMALRLQYDDVDISAINLPISEGFDTFIRQTNGPRRVFCTYTAMMELRTLLEKRYDLEAIDQ